MRSLNEIKDIVTKILLEYFDSEDVKTDNIDPKQMISPNMTSQNNINLMSPSVKQERSGFGDVLVATINQKCPYLKDFKVSCQYVKQYNQTSIIYDFNKKLDDIEVNIELFIRYYHKDFKMFHTNDYKYTLNFEIFKIEPDIDNQFGSNENISKDDEDEILINELNTLKKGNSVINLLSDVKTDINLKLKKFSNILAGKYDIDIFK